MGTRVSTEASVMNRPESINLVEFRKKILAGDLILIATRKTVESDIAIPPQLMHAIETTVKEKYSISKNIDLPVWDSAGIIVDMDLSEVSGKCILELTSEGFIVSEFISRMTEIKKKGFDISVRCLQGPKSLEFRTNLFNIAEFLAGKSFEDILNTIPDREIRLPVLSYLEDTTHDSTLKSQIREAFYLTVDNPDDFTISKAKLHDLIREFTGTNMDLTVEELADELNVEENVDFDEFYRRWVNGPGKETMKDEVYMQALLNGQFVKHVYKSLGVIDETVESISTPDDFANGYGDIGGLRSTFLRLINGFEFGLQTPVKL